MKYSSSFFLLLLLSPSTSQLALTPEPLTPPPFPTSATIQRTTKQQILATIPPNTSPDHYSPQPFLTSPSGKYIAFLLRTPTAPNAGGFGNDFCCVQIQDSETSTSLWESECAPVSTSNACTLVFDDAGLEVFDGSSSLYNTAADGNHVSTLELVDQGDLRIIDKDGELAWKASDEPRSNQGCGLLGSVGLAPESPPFAGMIGSGGSTGSRNGPFGQPVGAVVNQVGQQPVATAGRSGSESSEGFGGQPLVDNK